MFLQLGLQVLLPAFLLVNLSRGNLSSRLEWLLSVLAVSAILVFLILTARWDFTSYYLRILLPILLAPAAYLSYGRASRLPAESRKARPSAMIASAAIFLVVSCLNGIVLRGYAAPGPALELAYPLRGTTYYVGGGGNSRFINNHQAHEPQKFALDIVRLNAFGNRAVGLAPNELEQYAIFGDSVYSPCSGKVIQAVDGFPDHVPPRKDSSNPAGNRIVIVYEGGA